ncbi:MAG: hypothetical protein WDN24_10650 [Sphingomonas sp.]
MLGDALRRRAADRITLAPGHYPLGPLTFEGEVEIGGSAGTSVSGPLRVADDGRLRMVGIRIEDGLSAAGFAVLELAACHVAAGRSAASLTLDGRAQAIVLKTVLDGTGKVAMHAAGQAHGKVEFCRIAGPAVLLDQAAFLMRNNQLDRGTPRFRLPTALS